MKITIIGSGVDEDDDLVLYHVVAETETHKATVEFYAHADGFCQFAKQLLAFPFESKEDVVYKTGYYFPDECFLLKVSLADSLGKITFLVEMNDTEANSARFSDETVDTEALHRFAKRLLSTDFNQAVTIQWNSTDVGQ